MSRASCSSRLHCFAGYFRRSRGEQITIQVNQDGLHIGNVRIPLEPCGWLLYADPERAPKRHPEEHAQELATKAGRIKAACETMERLERELAEARGAAPARYRRRFRAADIVLTNGLDPAGCHSTRRERHRRLLRVCVRPLPPHESLTCRFGGARSGPIRSASSALRAAAGHLLSRARARGTKHWMLRHCCHRVPLHRNECRYRLCRIPALHLRSIIAYEPSGVDNGE